MKLFTKLIILIFYICFSSVGAFSESFKLTCDFGSSWNKFTPKVQTHIVIDDKVVIRPMMYLALSYDHRIIDGRESVGFLVAIKEGLESAEELLMDGDPQKAFEL